MRRQLVRWVAVAVAVPLAAAAARKVADTVEERRGPKSKVARGLRKAADTVRPDKKR
ncbi:hypothetical protein [Aquipuribacter nitratireducens]|uniref:Uncharacterized protein n=1 Tax=Aquipuribacter nitratireducens TaxID=650104 RepID=A0ABW0GH18_9MICO